MSLPALVSACGGTFGAPGGAVKGFSGDGVGQCLSELWWSSGMKGSSQMQPGVACRACHLSSDEGPRDAYMGTAYPALHEVDGCMAADVPSGAVVEILDASGQVRVSMPINTAGNFYSSSRGAVVSPYYARVRANGQVNAMSSPQTDGDCNTCHTADGLHDAPGRVLIPQPLPPGG